MATADATGFELSLDELTVLGGPGSAPVGVSVTVGAGSEPVSADDSAMTALSRPYEVIIDTRDRQPGESVTLRFAVDSDIARQARDQGHAFAVVSKNAQGQVDAVEATLSEDASSASVQVNHLTIFELVFFDPKKFVDSSVAVMTDLLEISFPKPDCVGESIRYTSSEVKIGPVTADVAWPCIRVADPDALDGPQVIDLYSNSPFVWILDTEPAWVSVKTEETDTDNAMLAPLFRKQLGSDVKFLAPGEHAAITFAPYTGSPRSGRLHRDQAVDRTALSAWAYSGAINEMFGFLPTLDIALNMLACTAEISGPLNAADKDPSLDNLGRLGTALINCGKNFLSGVASFILSKVGAAALASIPAILQRKENLTAATFAVNRETITTTGRGDATSCGTATFPQTQRVVDIFVDAGPIGCGEAMRVFERYLHDSTLTHIGNTRSAQFDGWLCATPTATAAETYGFASECTKGVNHIVARGRD